MPVASPRTLSHVVTSSKVSETPTTTGKIFRASPDGSQNQKITERVDISANSSYATLQIQLPPRCEIRWAQIKLQSAVTLAGADATGTADTFALLNALPTTSGTSATTTGVIGVAQTTLTSGTVTDIKPTNVIANTTTSAVTLYLMPIDNGGAQDFDVHTTATSGYHFSATANVDVTIWVTAFDAPAA